MTDNSAIIHIQYFSYQVNSGFFGLRLPAQLLKQLLRSPPQVVVQATSDLVVI